MFLHNGNSCLAIIVHILEHKQVYFKITNVHKFKIFINTLFTVGCFFRDIGLGFLEQMKEKHHTCSIEILRYTENRFKELMFS